MKSLISLGVAAAMLLAPPGARAADLTGTWQGAFDLHGTSMPLTLHLAVSSGAVTGTIEGLPTTPAEIHDGAIDGSKVSFWVDTDYQGQAYKVVFDGQISSTADEISFTMSTGDGSWSSALVAHRSAQTAPPPPAVVATPSPAAVPAPDAAPATASPDISGTWKGSFDYEDSPVPVTFHFTVSGGAVTGTVEGMMQGSPDKPIEIHDGKLDGDTLTFWLNTPYQGETYKIVYNGTVASGKIDFTFGTDDGSWSNELTATR